MNFLKVACRDISGIFKNRFIRASVTAIIVVPLLYTLLYLAAFWDPYSRLDKLPVAVVNLDKGSTKDGAPVNMGKDLADKLSKSDQLGWKITSKADGEHGLKGKKYYAEFIIPEDFTAKALSGATTKPEQPEIIYHANMKKNYLASQINNKVKDELKAEITKNITYEYTKVAFDNLFALKEGMSQAAKGSKQLKDGLVTLNGAVPELKSGVTQINDGVIALDSGIANAKNGAVTLNEGLGQINSKIPALVSGISDAYIGSSKVAIGANDLKVGSKQVSDGVNELISNVNASQAAIKQAVGVFMLDHDASKLLVTLSALQSQSSSQANVEKITKLQKGAKAVSDGAAIAANGAAQLNAGLGQLNEKVPALADGIEQSYKGSASLASGLGQLNDGSSKLKTGVGTLVGKLPMLEEGASKLVAGSTELNTELTVGSTKLNKSLVNNGTTMGKFVSDSVQIKESPINEVKNYGTGFAPYFICLSLYVGAMLMFFVVTDKVDADIKASNFALVIGKFFSYGYIGIAQGILAGIVVLFLGLKPNNIPLYFLFIIFISLVFIAIMQSLIFLLGDVGRMLAIVFLILQLTACGGTFPNELVPSFFNTINPFMPFTYAISGLREIISGTDYTLLTQDAVVLLGIMLGCLTISTLFKGHADKAKARIEELKNSMN